MTETDTTIYNDDDERITVRNTEKGVIIEWESPVYEVGVPNEYGECVINAGDTEQVTRSCAAVMNWLRRYDEKKIVNDCDLLILETNAHIILLRVRENETKFDIVQKGDYDNGLEARWSLFGYYYEETGFSFADVGDAIEFMRGMADACLAYRGLLRIPKKAAE